MVKRFCDCCGSEITGTKWAVIHIGKDMDVCSECFKVIWSAVDCVFSDFAERRRGR